MPAKILMNLTTSNIAMQTRQILQSNPIQNLSKGAPLNASMITRVHMSRPGCGSCGK